MSVFPNLALYVNLEVWLFEKNLANAAVLKLEPKLSCIVMIIDLNLFVKTSTMANFVCYY